MEVTKNFRAAVGTGLEHIEVEGCPGVDMVSLFIMGTS